MAHQPMALARRWAPWYTALISARDVGMVSAPVTWLTVRQAMREMGPSPWRSARW